MSDDAATGAAPPALPRLAVLDLAGTTVQDRGEVPVAFTAALAGAGVEVDAERIRAVRGASKRQAVLGFLPEGPGRAERAEEVYASFREHLARRYAEGARAVPGAEETIARLRGRGVRVALNTGFDRDITHLLLSALGWERGLVDAVVCGDDVPQGRPAPYLVFRAMEATGTQSVHEVLSAGDTALDLRAGHHAGVRWNVGVLSGAHPAERLRREPHTHLLPSVADLPGLWPAG